MNGVKPLVSVFCTAYNHEQFIDQCLSGLVMQITDFSIEILINDDASTDGTANIIKKYEAKYPDIICAIYQKENQYSQGINIWYEHLLPRAQGKYIAICEGDDYWIDPLKLQKQVDFLESNSDYSLCGHNAIILNCEEKRTVSLFNEYTENFDLSISHVVSEWLIPTASILVRKDVVLYSPDWCATIYSGDYKMLLLAYLKGKIRFLSDIMSVYRITYNGLSMTSQLKDKSSYINEQHILLLDSFNKGTNMIYSSTINEHVKKLNNEVLFFKLKKKSVFLVFIMQPQLAIKKILLKLNSLFN